MTRKRQSTKKRTRRRMYGRGQAASFIRKNVNRSDALAVATAALRPLTGLFSPPDMKEFLLMEQSVAGDPGGDATKSYLLARAEQLLEKYNAENRERYMQAQAARVAEMGPVVRSGLGISADGIPPAPLFSPPAPAPAPVTLPPPPPPLDLAAPPPMPLAPPISPSRSSGGRRRKTRRRGRR